jgi:hypothetical protein
MLPLTTRISARMNRSIGKIIRLLLTRSGASRELVSSLPGEQLDLQGPTQFRLCESMEV